MEEKRKLKIGVMAIFYFWLYLSVFFIFLDRMKGFIVKNPLSVESIILLFAVKGLTESFCFSIEPYRKESEMFSNNSINIEIE